MNFQDIMQNLHTKNLFNNMINTKHVIYLDNNVAKDLIKKNSFT